MFANNNKNQTCFLTTRAIDRDLTQLWFKIWERFHERVIIQVNKCMSTRFASLKGNISCIFNERQINFIHVILSRTLIGRFGL